MSSCWLQRIRDDTGAIQDDNPKEDNMKGDSLKGDNMKEDSMKRDSLTLPRKALVYPRLLKALIGGDIEEPTNLCYNVCLLHNSIVNIHPTVTRQQKCI